MDTGKITRGRFIPDVMHYKEDPKELYIGVKIETDVADYCVRVFDTILPNTDEEYISIHEELKSNCELVCEAFNVANETGLSPITLKQQRDELLGALRLLHAMAHLGLGHIHLFSTAKNPELEEGLNMYLEEAKSLIQKIEADK